MSAAGREWRPSVRQIRENEIEIGRAVPNDWERALVEPYAIRKARLAVERATQRRLAGIRS